MASGLALVFSVSDFWTACVESVYVVGSISVKIGLIPARTTGSAVAAKVNLEG
jgi:hypothetical protein